MNNQTTLILDKVDFTLQYRNHLSPIMFLKLFKLKILQGCHQVNTAAVHIWSLSDYSQAHLVSAQVIHHFAY